MEIKSAEFATSSPTIESCPTGNRAEYAFIGRSNVGKSSLINMLCARKSLAKTSSTPGKTLTINHFLINKEWYLVDLPGYGFAKISQKRREALRKMTSQYIQQRAQLTCLFQLVDIRLKPQKADIEFSNWLGINAVPFVIVFTKADKISRVVANVNTKAYIKALEETWEMPPDIFITSATKHSGRDDLLQYIDQINKSIAENSNK